MASDLTVLERLVAVGFALWFVASCLRQIPRPWADRLCAWDVVGILPVWRFFAPMPGPFDFHLLYRDRLGDGVTVTPWMEHLPIPRRRAISLLWNPDKRYRKALLDLAQELARAQARGTPDQILISVPYLVILQYISALPRPEPVAATQFALMVSEGAAYDPSPALLFLSSFHTL